MDRNHRPELMKGSVEFLVDKDYCIRDPQVSKYAKFSPNLFA